MSILHAIHLAWQILIVGMKLRFFLWAESRLQAIMDRGRSDRSTWSSYRYARCRIYWLFKEAEELKRRADRFEY